MALRQAQTTTFQLGALLTQDVIIVLEWDPVPAPAVVQGCKLYLEPPPAGGGAVRRAVDVLIDPGENKFSFHLSKGTRLTPPLTAELLTNPAAAAPPSIDIGFASGGIPQREAITTVYTELNQELRRMRTLYETYLVVITGGFATLVSKADAFVGPSARYRQGMGAVLFLLALIVSYLMWHVGNRYNRTSASIKNLETGLGLRGGAAPWPLIVDVVPPRPGDKWWQLWKRFEKDDHRRHIVWAVLLITYTVALGVLALLLLVRSKVPDTSATQSTAAQIVQTIQQAGEAPVPRSKEAPDTPCTPAAKAKKAQNR
jgi:hypothetical protein